VNTPTRAVDIGFRKVDTRRSGFFSKFLGAVLAAHNGDRVPAALAAGAAVTLGCGLVTRYVMPEEQLLLVKVPAGTLP
jgi:hypothetical protein